ncbi:FadR/GntR family transcriptional regulator [Streptomyces iranensis]|uniref:GntR domain protein n=1 Tax=Streptomyces iranensis TaxID=576784 RepID=A0A060ZIY1_9ACTN|nr:FadR/GntR family transcriptional regulator [Streptomyces iranensis]MBP2063363.1 GntR family transcriptional repressor for pyruvate dehydrogenase complex [Streptomyces iranensis]CDR01674.1 GntR domain protein [Streptomyces iranensis]
MGRLSDQVVAQLRQAIVHEEYAPGSRMPTAESLAESLGVSRSVVRDALRTLSSMGLVEVRQGHGIFVAVPRDDILTTALTLRMQRSDVTIGEVLAARVTLESTLAAEAARVRDDETLRPLRGHLRRFEDGVRAKDWPTAHQEHLQFHLSIIRALRLPALELLIEPLQELIIVSSIPPEPESGEQWGIGSHDPIVEALESGDPEAARTAVRDHFRYAESPPYREYGQTPFRDVRSVLAGLR